MARRASMKAMMGQRAGGLSAVCVVLLAGGCGGSFQYAAGVRLDRPGLDPEAGTRREFAAGTSDLAAEPAGAPLSEVTTGLVAARRRGKLEAIPGFEDRKSVV